MFLIKLNVLSSSSLGNYIGSKNKNFGKGNGIKFGVIGTNWEHKK
jgi:hypothetical protein